MLGLRPPYLPVWMVGWRTDRLARACSDPWDRYVRAWSDPWRLVRACSDPWDRYVRAWSDPWRPVRACSDPWRLVRACSDPWDRYVRAWSDPWRLVRAWSDPWCRIRLTERVDPWSYPITSRANPAPFKHQFVRTDGINIYVRSLLTFLGGNFYVGRVGWWVKYFSWTYVVSSVCREDCVSM